MDQYVLSAEMKSNLPFKGGEKVYFMPFNSRQLMLGGEDRENSIIEVPIGKNTSYYETRESERITFLNSNDRIVYRLWSERHNFYEPTLSIDRYIGEERTQITLPIPLSVETSQYVDSLFVIDRWIKEVYIAIQSTQTDPDTVYYSQQFGVIKWISINHPDWELEKIEW